MGEKIFINGKLAGKKTAGFSVREPGLLYGWGVFETMRAYRQHIVHLERHLKRIEKSCKILDIPLEYSTSSLRVLVNKAVNSSIFRDAYLRLTIYKKQAGSDTILMLKKYKPYTNPEYKKGFKACVSSLRQNEGSLLSQLKTTNYLFYQLAYQDAVSKGFDEALILNNSGYIAEGSRSNIFWVKNGRIITPSLANGCLDGITRRIVFDIAKRNNLYLFEKKAVLSSLHKADEAFLTNSLIGVMPLAAVGNRYIGKRGIGRLTAFLMQEYRNLLMNDKGD